MLFHAGKWTEFSDMYDESVPFQTPLTLLNMRPLKIPGIVCIGLRREKITWQMWV